MAWWRCIGDGKLVVFPKISIPPTYRHGCVVVICDKIETHYTHLEHTHLRYIGMIYTDWFDITIRTHLILWWHKLGNWHILCLCVCRCQTACPRFGFFCHWFWSPARTLHRNCISFEVKYSFIHTFIAISATHSIWLWKLESLQPTRTHTTVRQKSEQLVLSD